MAEPLATRRALLRDCVLPQLNEPVRECAVLEASLAELVAAVGAQGLEGLVAKRLDSRYEPGQRSGAWQKMPVNRSQEFVIGGYTPSARNFDALIFGYYDGDRLLYAGRTRSGFTPESREKLFKSFWGMESATCAGWRIRICGMDAGWAPPASGLHSRAGWKAGGVATR
jgi:bifunctional non-homologous end joining protein LigD